MRLAAYAAHVLAVVALFVAGRRVPSLRRPAWAVVAWLLLSPLRGFGRDDGRALYHVAQAAEMLDHALLVALAGAPWWVAAGLWCVAVVAGVWWWPASAAPLYAAAQAVTVLVAVVALVVQLRAARVPLSGHLVALILVASELAAIVAPYALAVSLGTTVAEQWSAALPIRLATWGALIVVGWHTWHSAQPWPSSRGSSPPARGRRGARGPRSGSSVTERSDGGRSGSDGSGAGASLG